MSHKFAMFGLLLCLFAFTSVSLLAQDEVTYRLRVPDAETYLNNLVQLYDDPALHQESPNSRLRGAIEDEIFLRYENIDQVDPQLLLTVYNTMGIGRGNRDTWNERILENWLNQDAIDLSTMRTLAFQDYRIQVTPRDFDGDGVNEYVLDTIKGQREDFDRSHACGYPAEYVDYVVVKQYGDRYRMVETPLSWYGYSDGRFGTQGGVMEIRFEDLNADGLPEWVLMDGGIVGGGPGSGYINNGYLAILSWRDGRLVDLTTLNRDKQYANSPSTRYEEDAGVCHGPEPRDITWEFANIDDDPAQEILQHQVYLDNWDCLERDTKVLDWDATQRLYVASETQYDFPEYTQNCARRQAEEAMWAGDYQQALVYYEQSLNLQPYIHPRPGRFLNEKGEITHQITYDQYHRARMALAYILTDQPEQARPILASLNSEFSPLDTLRFFVDGLLANMDTPLSACLASYQVFTQYYRPPPSYELPYFGLTIKQGYGSYPVYEPALVGCDAPTMIMHTLENQTLTDQQTPVAYLENLGVPVEKFITADFDLDGQDEWLVWPQSLMNPFFFTLTDEGIYSVSNPAVDPYHNADEVFLQRLPDENGFAVGYLISNDFRRAYPAPWGCVYDGICGIGGAYFQCIPDAHTGLTLWRMEKLTLVRMLRNMNVCAEDFADLFPDGAGSNLLDGGTFIFEDEAPTPQLYAWDSTVNTFVKVGQTANPANSSADVYIRPKYESYSNALQAGDYIKALAMLDEDEARSRDYDAVNPNADALYDYRYHRGFILEMLNRPDEALAEYVAIYEAAPDSAWGMLAALHLEIVDH